MRALALAVLLAALVVYGVVAESLPELRSRASLAVVALLVVPTFMATIWLALPLERIRPAYYVLIGAASAGVAWVVLAFAGVGSLANVCKFSCFALIGLWFISLFEELWWVALVAVLVPWLDVWSVAVGPTRYVVEEQPGIFDRLSVAFAVPGDAGTVNLGPPDVIFFSLFLAAASRFGLRVAWTWIAMTGCLAFTLVLVWEWNVVGLPALPAICAGFLLPNIDLLWRHVRTEWRERQTGGSEAG